jgi:hypothetical protein
MPTQRNTSPHAGAVGYVLVDSDFKVHAYFWLALW